MMVGSAVECLHAQLALERKGVSPDGRLYRLPGDNPDDIARVLVTRLAGDALAVYVRDDVPEAVVRRIRQVSADVLLTEPTLMGEILEGPTSLAWKGSAYVFVRSPSPAEFALTSPSGEAFVVTRAGEVAAWAWSSRQTERAAELAVETAPAFRRNGLARQVCAAWAARQLADGRLAFYSHSADNVASAALAHSLGVEWFMDATAYE